MRNFLILILVLFLPLLISAQKYQGKYYNPEVKAGYTIHFLIRPDSSISLTFETVAQDKNDFERARYYDFHGNISKKVAGANNFSYCESAGDKQKFIAEDQVIYTLDMKSIFTFELRDDNYNHWQKKIGEDTLAIAFDSARIFLDRNISWSYGKIHDSVYISNSMLRASFAYRYGDSAQYLAGMPWRKTFAYGYPRGLEDTMHVSGLEIGVLYLPLNSSAYNSSKEIKLDIGYVNPVTGLPVSFTVPHGKYPYIHGDDSEQFCFIIEDGELHFFGFTGSRPLLQDSAPIILAEFK